MLLSALLQIFFKLPQLFLLFEVLTPLILVDFEDLDVGVDFGHLLVECLDFTVDLWLLID